MQLPRHLLRKHGLLVTLEEIFLFERVDNTEYFRALLSFLNVVGSECQTRSKCTKLEAPVSSKSWNDLAVCKAGAHSLSPTSNKIFHLQKKCFRYDSCAKLGVAEQNSISRLGLLQIGAGSAVEATYSTQGTKICSFARHVYRQERGLERQRSICEAEMNQIDCIWNQNGKNEENIYSLYALCIVCI